ncbi:unnamed protein product [Toxocara canis]|uniref:Phosphatidylinositol transfer protein n=1 Tax=Toxocara canis TaxID=6265 RepID=A0A183V6Y2_TOXCA|nr:unnamed protein product [Toxocara canis]
MRLKGQYCFSLFHRNDGFQEYRVLLPLEVTEYQRGQLYTVAEVSKNETGGGDGVEASSTAAMSTSLADQKVAAIPASTAKMDLDFCCYFQVVKQEEFTSDKIKPGETLNGTYTYKIYYSKSKSPWVFRKLLPDAAFVLHEECWNAYPYCRTVITNPDYMKENFYLTIESMHLPDSGETENALGLSKDLLKKREVVMIDIYDDSVLKQPDITPDTDPRTFKSKKTGRGELTADWSVTTKPVMCCYKVVQIQFKMFGLQRLVEGLSQRQYPRIFSKFNRETFCSIDKWYDMTMEQIRELEEETAETLKKRIKDAEKRGTVCDVGDREKKSDLQID